MCAKSKAEYNIEEKIVAECPTSSNGKERSDGWSIGEKGLHAVLYYVLLCVCFCLLTTRETNECPGCAYVLFDP